MMMMTIGEEERKEKKRQYAVKYRLINKAKHDAYNVQYRKDNRESLNEYHRNYMASHPALRGRRISCTSETCMKHKVRPSLKNSVYKQGYKRCTPCANYLDWKGDYCPCCKKRLRTRGFASGSWKGKRPWEIRI